MRLPVRRRCTEEWLEHQQQMLERRGKLSKHVGVCSPVLFSSKEPFHILQTAPVCSRCKTKQEFLVLFEQALVQDENYSNHAGSQSPSLPCPTAL